MYVTVTCEAHNPCLQGSFTFPLKSKSYGMKRYELKGETRLAIKYIREAGAGAVLVCAPGT